jgi:hypothetical protein
MNHPEISPDNNQNSLRIVLRAINFSQGQLSFIFLRCNYAKLRQQISAQIHQVSSIPIREITLTASTKSLYNQISQELGNEQPPALMISGLDSVKNIDVILNVSNQLREEFRKNFPFPILIWIDDQILKKIIRVAPDLESWGSILDFENDGEDLINLLQETTEEIFINDHIPSPQVYQEIEFATQDLQNRKAVINPEIQAGLNLAFGLREYQQDHLDHALSYFQKSGEFWQNNLNNNLNHNLERYGIILVKISLVYTRKAEINNGEDLENWQNSRNYLQQAVEIFEKAQRLDLVIQYINDLGEIFRHLKAWNDLENLAQKSLKLSENVEILPKTSNNYIKELKAENLLQEFQGHQDAVTSVSFSPDGQTIATASYDNTARLWPVRNLDRVLKDGCAWVKDYLHNPGIKLSDPERRLCDDI